MMRIPTYLFSALFLTLALSLGAQQADTLKIKPYFYEVNYYVDDNEQCLKCHGEKKYVLRDTVMNRSVTEQMCPDRIINRDEYYSSQHKAFSCTDCHSYDFTEFPHHVETRLEEHLVCMDCHGYDETFASYHFEDIEAEFEQSIHHIEGFTCWKCHNPHSYRAFMRNTTDLEEAILYDNNMCLRCHANFQRFMLLTDRKEINVVQRHEWLPNQASHFKHVRCIECHTEINDSILVAHKILPKSKAVQRCTECHSRDSRLLHTLYKFQSMEEKKAGFVNGVIVNTSFVVGANRNPLLNKLSFLIVGCALLGMGFHVYLRIRNQKPN
jgi:hypothetical protein